MRGRGVSAPPVHLDAGAGWTVAAPDDVAELAPVARERDEAAAYGDQLRRFHR